MEVREPWKLADAWETMSPPAQQRGDLIGTTKHPGLKFLDRSGRRVGTVRVKKQDSPVERAGVKCCRPSHAGESAPWSMPGDTHVPVLGQLKASRGKQARRRYRGPCRHKQCAARKDRDCSSESPKLIDLKVPVDIYRHVKNAAHPEQRKSCRKNKFTPKGRPHYCTDCARPRIMATLGHANEHMGQQEHDALGLSSADSC